MDAIRYEPNNEELKNELLKIEHLCTQSKEKEPLQDVEVSNLEHNPLTLPNSDDISNIVNPSKSVGSWMGVKQSSGILYECHPEVAQSKMNLVDIQLNRKERENPLEEQSDRALSKNFHHISTNVALDKEIHKNQTLNRVVLL